MIKKLLTVFFAVYSLFLFSQERRITGQIFSQEDGEPLPEAYVLIKGTSLGAKTDAEGKFTYLVKDPSFKDLNLEISFIGMDTKVIPIGNQDYFKVYLQPSANDIEEVIVTSSYGTTKLKEEVVGSISTIKMTDVIEEQPAISFDELLEGQAAGVLVEGNPELGGPVDINIRGQGSLTPLSGTVLNTSTQPLIFVDGIRVSEEIFLDVSRVFDGGTGIFNETEMNPLAKIGIQDIQSINILKDAAAVGLYGADAANGVIIITTKNGRKGPLKFGFSAQYGVSDPINRQKYLNGEQYSEVYNAYRTLRNQDPIPWNGVDTDWFDLLNRTGSFARYNLNVSGGTRNWLYRMGLGYQKNQEAQIENSFEKITGNFSLTYQHDKLKSTLKLAPSYTLKKAPNTFFSYPLPPTIAPYDNNGNYTDIDNYGNPLAVANQNRNDIDTFGLLGSFNLEYNLLENLKIATLFGLDYSNKEQDRWFSGANGSGQYNGTFESDGITYPNYGRRILNNRKTTSWNWNATIAYNKQFAQNHFFDIVAGVETSSEHRQYERFNGTGFISPEIEQPYENAGNTRTNKDSSTITKRSLFSQLNYNFNEKYFFLANFRRDESSVFGNDTDVAYNGGIGASWVISKESFLESIHWIDFLRLRTSYGVTGNSRIGSYRSLGLYNVDDDLNQPNGYNGGDTATPDTSTPPNSELGWEKNYKFNIGLDLNFLNKFSFTTEWFRDDIQDMIVSRDVSDETGYTSSQINGADMYNTGFEFSLRANWFKKDNFSWTTSANLATLKNKVTDLVGLSSEFSASSRARAQMIGSSTSALWGFQYAGVDPATGREMFNVNGNLYDAAYIDQNFDSSDYSIIGNTQPDFYGGFNNRFRFFKNFDLAINMSFTYGADTFIDATNGISVNNDIGVRNISINNIDYWQQPGDITSNPRPYLEFVRNSSKYVYDNSHIRLRAVNLGYTLPVDKMNVPFKSIKIFVNGSNLYYWYKEKSPKGLNGIAEYRYNYPEARTFSFGINAKF